MDSGLNSGVWTNCRKRVDMRFRRPMKVFWLRPRLSKSASRSINLTISRVRVQSNSYQSLAFGSKKNKWFRAYLNCVLDVQQNLQSLVDTHQVHVKSMV